MGNVFGSLYAPAYDALYRDKDYDGEVEMLKRAFHRYAVQPVRSVLDLGCGTGNHALGLLKRGYHVVGVDRSEEMLAIAHLKAQMQQAVLRTEHADIQEVELGETFDAVIMMFSVMSYQTQNNEARRVLSAARRHLRSGGIVVFDVWYGPGVMAQGLEERVRTIEHEGTTWTRTASGRLDGLRQQCRVEFNLKQVRDGTVIARTVECHVMRFYFPLEIELLLNISGFRLRRLGGFPEFDRDPEAGAWNVLVVAEAV